MELYYPGVMVTVTLIADSALLVHRAILCAPSSVLLKNMYQYNIINRQISVPFIVTIILVASLLLLRVGLDPCSSMCVSIWVKPGGLVDKFMEGRWSCHNVNRSA